MHTLILFPFSEILKDRDRESGRERPGCSSQLVAAGVLPPPTMVDEEVKAPEGSVCLAHNRCQGQELEHLQEAWG